MSSNAPLILISASALTLSIISLIVTFIQKYQETKRSIRKTLTDTLEAISKINIETSKLKSSLGPEEFNSEVTIQLRRNYNSQRRILIAHADFLVNKYASVTTDIDYMLLAGAHNVNSNIEQAKSYWELAVLKSRTSQTKHTNLRGYALFLFEIGEIEVGRQKFQEALLISLSQTDSDKHLLADTYLMMSDVEKDFGNKPESDTYLTKCIELWGEIRNERRKNEVYERIHFRIKKDGL
jgi:tetratricopeptide (TPR) repeat protein